MNVSGKGFLAKNPKITGELAYSMPLEDLWQIILLVTKNKNRLPKRSQQRNAAMGIKKFLQNIFILRVLKEARSTQIFIGQAEILLEGGKVKISRSGNDSELLYLQYTDGISWSYNGGTHHPQWQLSKEARKMLEKIGFNC